MILANTRLVALMSTPLPPRVRARAGTRIAPAWEFDIPAIERACDELGIIDYAVVIGCAEYPSGRKLGLYRFVDSEHVITCRRADGPHAVSATLWHELAHAMQYERDGREGHRGYGTSRLRGDAYWNHPAEIEARSYEARARTHPLVERHCNV